MLVLLIFYINHVLSTPINSDSMFNGMTCPSLSDKMEAAECIPMLREIGKKNSGLKIENKSLDRNDPNIAELLENCAKLQPCLESTCFPKNVTQTVGVLCKGVELQTTEFFKCIISGHPDETKLSACSNSSSLEELYKMNNECFKTAVKDSCGEGAIENFDLNFSILVEISNQTSTTLTKSASIFDTGRIMESCPSNEEKIGATKCLNLYTAMGNKTDHDAENVNRDCEELESCLNSSCLPGDMKNNMNQLCDKLKFKESEFSKCLVNISQTSNIARCMIDYENNSTGIVKWLLTEQKICMKSVMKESCGTEAVENFDDDSAEYLKVSSLVGTKPETTTQNSVKESCPDSGDLRKTAECKPLLEEYATKTQKYNKPLEINGTEILDLLDICKRVQDCVRPTCLPEILKETLASGCQASELRNTEFGNCLAILKAKNPERPCMGSRSFTNGPVADGIELFTTKKDCTKTIMRDFCGEKSLVDFDKNAEIVVNLTRIEVSKLTTVAPKIRSV